MNNVDSVTDLYAYFCHRSTPAHTKLYQAEMPQIPLEEETRYEAKRIPRQQSLVRQIAILLVIKPLQECANAPSAIWNVF